MAFLAHLKTMCQKRLRRRMIATKMMFLAHQARMQKTQQISLSGTCQKAIRHVPETMCQKVRMTMCQKVRRSMCQNLAQGGASK